MSKSIADDPRIGSTHDRALCCTCGTLRLVSAKYSASNMTAEGYGPELIRARRNETTGRRLEYWSQVQPFQRVTGDLKCVTCKSLTRHAWIRDCDKPEARDYAERREADERLEVRELEAELRLRATLEYRSRDDDLFLYSIEQAKFDSHFTVVIGEHLPRPIRIRALQYALRNVMDDQSGRAKITWARENKSARNSSWGMANELADEYRAWEEFGLLPRQVEAGLEA